MADAPTVQRPIEPPTQPARTAARGAAVAGGTDVQPVAPSYGDEDTSSLHMPDAAALVEQVLHLVAV
jgi:hypothetical protein